MQKQVLQQEGQIVQIDFDVNIALQKQRQDSSSQRLKTKTQNELRHMWQYVKGVKLCKSSDLLPQGAGLIDGEWYTVVW